MDDLTRAVSNDPPPWSLARRLGFRFVFAYLFLFLFPFPLWALPGFDWLSGAWGSAWQALVPWVADRVLGLGTGFTINGNGSGDTTLEYVMVLTTVAMALVAVLVW